MSNIKKRRREVGKVFTRGVEVLLTNEFLGRRVRASRVESDYNKRSFDGLARCLKGVSLELVNEMD